MQGLKALQTKDLSKLEKHDCLACCFVELPMVTWRVSQCETSLLFVCCVGLPFNIQLVGFDHSTVG